MLLQRDDILCYSGSHYHTLYAEGYKQIRIVSIFLYNRILEKILVSEITQGLEWASDSTFTDNVVSGFCHLLVLISKS